eukprot:619417-Amphidinium_carterae.1
MPKSVQSLGHELQFLLFLPRRGRWLLWHPPQLSRDSNSCGEYLYMLRGMCSASDVTLWWQH